MLFKPYSLAELEEELDDLLSRNNLSNNDISVFINGRSGDVENDQLLINFQTKRFPAIPELRFKHLSGEYCTASSFGFWLGASLLKNQKIPDGVQFNTAPVPANYRNLLMVNQYMGRNYSFVLLQRCDVP